MFITILTKYYLLFLFLFSISIFLVHYLVTGQAVYGDGVGYYAHLHSWIVDNDWDYTNEYQHIYSPENNNALEPVSAQSVQIVSMTPAGRAANHFFPGTALLLLPAYLIAHLVTKTVLAFGGALPITGYSDIYQVLSGAMAVLYGVSGVWLLQKILERHGCSRLVAVVSVSMLFFSSNLLYYLSYDVINSHFASFFLTNLFFYCWLFWVKEKHQPAILGIIAALMTMVRLQDGVIITIVWLVVQLIKRTSLRQLVLTLAWFFVSYLVTALPLLIYMIETFGSVWNHTYIQAFISERNTSAVDWIGSLFSKSNGLFVVSPLLAVLFTYYLAESMIAKKIMYPLFLSFFLLQFIVISLQGGWQAAAYGGRMYVSSMVFFGLVLARLIDLIKTQKFLLIIICLYTVINFVSVAQFVLVGKEAEGDQRGLETRTLERLNSLLSI